MRSVFTGHPCGLDIRMVSYPAVRPVVEQQPRHRLLAPERRAVQRRVALAILAVRVGARAQQLLAAVPWPRTDASMSAVSPSALDASTAAPASSSTARQSLWPMYAASSSGVQPAPHFTFGSAPFARSVMASRMLSSITACRSRQPDDAAPRCFDTIASSPTAAAAAAAAAGSDAASGPPSSPVMVDHGAWAASADMRSQASEQPPRLELGLGADDFFFLDDDGCCCCWPLWRAAGDSPPPPAFSLPPVRVSACCCCGCVGGGAPPPPPSFESMRACSAWKSCRRTWLASARVVGENGASAAAGRRSGVPCSSTPCAAAATGQPLAKSARSGCCGCSPSAAAPGGCRLKPGNPIRARWRSPPAAAACCCCWVRCVSTDTRSISSGRGIPPPGACCCRRWFCCALRGAPREDGRRTPRCCSFVQGRVPSSICCCHVAWPALHECAAMCRQRSAAGATEALWWWASGVFTHRPMCWAAFPRGCRAPALRGPVPGRENWAALLGEARPSLVAGWRGSSSISCVARRLVTATLHRGVRLWPHNARGCFLSDGKPCQPPRLTKPLPALLAAQRWCWRRAEPLPGRAQAPTAAGDVKTSGCERIRAASMRS